MTVELETDRLRLRPLGESDHAPLVRFYADPESTRYLGGTANAADTWHWLLAMIGHWSVRGFGYFAVEDKVDGSFCGAAGLIKHFDWPEIEVAWRVMAEKRGRGFATEAARRVRDYAFDALGAETLVSYIDPANQPSLRLAERLGATHDSTIELRGRPAEVYRHPHPLN